ncbi:putative caspase recruitment domain-containing protein 17P isoform X4 [Macaca mulatta]
MAGESFTVLRRGPWEERILEDKVLKEKRKLLIRSMGEGTINGLLDELLETRVLNQEEMEKVKCENAPVMDKARALLDYVIRKGAPACHICITYICEEDSHLAGTLGLSAGPTSGNHLTTQDSQVVLPSFLDKVLTEKRKLLIRSLDEGPTSGNHLTTEYSRLVLPS